MALVRTRPRIKHVRAPIAATISNKHLGFGTWKAPASPSGSSWGRPDMLAPSRHWAPASAGAAARRGDRDDCAGEPTGGKMRKAEHRPAGGADDQGFGKAGERIAQ